MSYLFVGHPAMKRHAVLRNREAQGLELLTMDECAHACERLRSGDLHHLFLALDEDCAADGGLLAPLAAAS